MAQLYHDYDTELFFDILISEGASCGEEWLYKNHIVKTTIGRSGVPLFIVSNYEKISSTSAIAYLTQLGSDYLISRMFPAKPETDTTPDFPPSSV